MRVVAAAAAVELSRFKIAVCSNFVLYVVQIVSVAGLRCPLERQYGKRWDRAVWAFVLVFFIAELVSYSRMCFP